MTNEFTFHQDFSVSYQCLLLSEMPAGHQSILHFNPARKPNICHDGLLLKIAPHDGSPWIGVFEWGDPSSDSPITGCWSLPHEHNICVVSRGTAYIVPVSEAESYSVLPLTPVCHVVPVPSHGIVVFGDFIKLCALGKHGVRWTTGRLSWDGLQLLGIEDGCLVGAGWDAPNQRNIGFRVCLNTGSHEGGSAPPLKE